MKRFGKKDKVVRGAPSGFVVSIMIHAAAFLLAGMLVVFTVTKKEDKKFVPPKPLDRPKMKLKKPKVKVKKSVKPKSTTRIVTKVKSASMPDIQLPEMSGMTDGLAGGIGGFDIMPTEIEETLFGGGQTIGNDFVGTFYDFKRGRNGRPNSMSEAKFVNELSIFLRGGWKTSRLTKYYRSPKKLYATTIMVPPVRSQVAPTAFGEPDTIGYVWMVHYKGNLVYPEDIKFRFWGHGDDIMVLRVDGEIVLNASWPSGDDAGAIQAGCGGWTSTSADSSKYWLGNGGAIVGDWIELKAGEALPMEVMIAEVPGGEFCSMLTVEVEGMDYPRNRQGGPILPIFKTEEPSVDLQDVIYRDLVKNEASLTNGPVFRDYATKSQIRVAKDVVAENAVFEEQVKGEAYLRLWTTLSGKQFEAQYVAVLGDKVTVKTLEGKQQKVSLSDLSSEDREYIELENPPEFALDFVKLSFAVMDRYKLSPSELRWDSALPRVNDFEFGAKVKQTGVRNYNHELTIEYFAIAKELPGDKYILVDRGSDTFIPTKENRRSYAFKGGQPLEFMVYDLGGAYRGKKYSGNLITLTDKRGKIIQYKTSSPWLWDHLNNLKNIPIGRYMDKTCVRVHPTSPKATRY